MLAFLLDLSNVTLLCVNKHAAAFLQYKHAALQIPYLLINGDGTREHGEHLQTSAATKHTHTRTRTQSKAKELT